MFIWKPRKSWGRLLSLQDLEPDQPEQRKGKTITQRGCRSKRTLFFVGNIEPLLLAGADYGRYVARTEPEIVMVERKITPEEVERAIGAAFAIGTAAQSSSSMVRKIT